MSHQTLDLPAAVGRNAVAYVRKVCAQAHIGFNETSAGEDFLAIDGTIEYPEQSVRVQIKGTTTRSLTATGDLSMLIEDTWRRKWQRNKGATYMIWVLMSRDIDTWFSYQECDTLASSFALWARVDQLPETATHINFDRTVRFTPATIGAWGRQLNEAGFGDSGVAS
jgi:hypothetical protein